MTLIITSLIIVVFIAILAQLVIKGWSLRQGTISTTDISNIKNPFKIFYIGNYGMNNGCGVISVATEVVSNGYLRVGFSFCSPKDVFRKETGREMAKSRMFWATKFTGHSSEDVIRLFNDEMRVDGKPGRWRKIKLCLEPDYTVGFYKDNGKTWDD